MGVKHLWEVLDSCKKTLPLHCLENKRVCVDLSCWVVQLHNVNKSHCSLKSKVYLQGLFHRLRALIALNCTLIFVSDGSIPAIKLSTYWRRLNCGVEVPQHETNPEKVTSLRRNMGSEFSVMIKEAKLLALALGIPCLDGIEEAEAQCALLNSESLCDGCFTSDSDAFLFGARTVYRDICLGEGGHVVCYEMADIESKLGFGRNSLISLALLLGSDYSSGVRGMGLETSCHMVKSIGDTLILQHIISEGLPFAKKKSSKTHIAHEMNMNENSHNPQKANIIEQVIEAYLNPKCHPTNSTTVLRALAQHQFERARLQQLCFQFFEWPLEKTDEYILPKIAERELRRFANLRLASSELGVKLSDKIPVKCPVSGIVKRRKAQGREYFEVLWDDLDGLTSSAVPADLIERACPEKIVEFENKVQAKKQNKHKIVSKKQENKVSLADIELRLENLMLEIESRSSLSQNTSFASSYLSGDKEVDHLEEESSSQTLLCYQTHSSCSEDVIDLVTPTGVKAVSRCIQAVDVISLSDSESDMSPQHHPKAKQPMCFIATTNKDGNL